MIGVVPISGPISHLPSAGRVFRAAHSLPGPHQHPLTSCGFARVVAHRGIVLVRADKEPKAGEDSDLVKNEVDNEDEDPVWVRREKMKKLQKEEAADLPFFVYLLLSGVVAIAAVGSVFEFFNQRAIFGVLEPSSPLWLPILVFFATTGLPVSGWMFFRAVEAANKRAEQMDEVDRA